MNLNPIDAFRDVAKDPSAWRAKAVTLRGAAQALWDSFITFLATDAGPLKTPEERALILDRLFERIHTSQLLYGLATEAALKARIIESDPASVEFREQRDGEGNVVDLRIVKIGVNLGRDGHDLVKLAEAAGVADGGAASLVDSDRTAIKEILAYLTDCVRWSGRYPVPKTFSERYYPGHGCFDS